MTERLEVYVLLLVGDTALVRVPDIGPDVEVRMQAAVIAADAQLPADELPGRDFSAIAEGKDGEIILRDFRLLNDPRI